MIDVETLSPKARQAFAALHQVGHEVRLLEPQGPRDFFSCEVYRNGRILQWARAENIEQAIHFVASALCQLGLVTLETPTERKTACPTN